MQNQEATDPSRQIYDKNNDQHVFAIDRLVHELGLPAEEVNSSYREVLDALIKDDTTKAFLPILASRGVKERLGEKRRSVIF